MNESTYGFNKADAVDILNSLGNRDQEYSGRIPRDTFSSLSSTALLGRTGSGGIPLGGPYPVTLYDEVPGGWALGSTIVSCWTFPTAIEPFADVLILEVGTRLLALELC